MKPGDILQDRYQLQRLLGRGGMGSIHLAQHLRLGRAVAVKCLLHQSTDPAERASQIRQLEAEARLLAGLDHPNLARVLDFFEEGPTPCLVMEYIQGQTLEDLVRASGRGVPQATALSWADQILRTLQYLHDQPDPVVVRDLNPRNVMVDHAGHVRLIDFGLARALEPGTATRTVLRGLGTEGYTPLEQYGTSTTDQRSDLYAFGATLLFLLTGEAPPAAHDRVARNLDLPDPRAVNPTVSVRTWEAIQSLMALTPDARPAKVSEVRRLLGLDAYAQTESTPVRQTVERDLRAETNLAAIGGFSGIASTIFGAAAILTFTLNALALLIQLRGRFTSDGLLAMAFLTVCTAILAGVSYGFWRLATGLGFDGRLATLFTPARNRPRGFSERARKVAIAVGSFMMFILLYDTLWPRPLDPTAAPVWQAIEHMPGLIKLGYFLSGAFLLSVLTSPASAAICSPAYQPALRDSTEELDLLSSPCCWLPITILVLATLIMKCT